MTRTLWLLVAVIALCLVATFALGASLAPADKAKGAEMIRAQGYECQAITGHKAIKRLRLYRVTCGAHQYEVTITPTGRAALRPLNN